MSPYILKNKIIIAKPIADSAAATVKINKAKTCPIISSIYTEKKRKFKLIDNNNISIYIKIIIIFCLFKTIPNNPRQNKKKLIIKLFNKYINL
jgi:hypothetical protein